MIYFPYSHLRASIATVTPHSIALDGHTTCPALDSAATHGHICALALTTRKAASSALPHGLPHPTDRASKLQYVKC